ncbi:hypothetical protein RCG71_19430 [Kocuria sp. CPCC 205281]
MLFVLGLGELIDPYLTSESPASRAAVPTSQSIIGSWLVFSLILSVALTTWWASRRRKKPDERA